MSGDDTDSVPTSEDDTDRVPTSGDDTDRVPTSGDDTERECFAGALPPDVVDAIESRLPRTEYETVEGYAVAALRGLLREAETAPDDPARAAGGGAEDCATPASDADDDDVPGADVDEDLEDRLESLGYL